MAPVDDHSQVLCDPIRLAMLRRAGLMDEAPDEGFDRIARLTAGLLNVSSAAIHLVAEERPFCRSRVGASSSLPPGSPVPLDALLSRHVMASGEPLVIRDATTHPLAADRAGEVRNGVTAYAGAPLVTPRGDLVGALCAVDSRSRDWTDADVHALHDLACVAAREIELRLESAEHRAAQDELRDCEARSRTERRSAEEELHIQRALLEELFYSAPEAIVLLDPDHHVIRVNPEFTRIFGYSLDEIAGMAIDDVIGHGALHEEAVSITQRIMGGETIGVETVRRRRDGSEVHVSIIGAPIRVGNDQIAVYGIYRDISGRKQAEMRLSAAEAHYRLLVEKSPYGIYTLDAEGRFTELNPAACAIIDRSSEELIGVHFRDVIAPEDRRYAEDLFLERMAGGTVSQEFDLHVLHRSGARRLVRINAAVVEDGNGVPTVHSIVYDITDERAREAQLRRAERLATVGTLVGGVAHELNNPLTAIKNFAQLMLLEEPSAEDAESLEIIRREADRAARIIADLRVLAGQTQNGGDGYRAFLDLNEVVRHVLRVREYALDANEIQVEEALAEDLPFIHAVPTEMEQVVLNLVINAEHAMLETSGDRRLIVQTFPGESSVCLRIQDRGAGIPADFLERIFDPFWTTKEPGVGTGLGLSLVHGIVTDHGGTIHVDSVPAQGTVFTLELPRADSAPELPESPGRGRRAERPLRVLIVDDEEAIRDSLSRFLEGRGHHVERAAEGREALARITAAEAEGVVYDVILADLRMPGLGGEELLAHLRDRDEAWVDRLVFVTGDAMSADAERFLETAGVPVVLKPFELCEVADLVERRAESRAAVEP